jgi:hypothetical protein
MGAGVIYIYMQSYSGGQPAIERARDSVLANLGRGIDTMRRVVWGVNWMAGSEG